MDRELPLISVIVPVYKTENYLDQCVQSIVDQTYRNLEIILVDDGSPDRCPQMCDEWAAKDDRIRVIHQCNQGLSSARNAGITSASGEYLFVDDSDDWIEASLVNLCLKRIARDASDIVLFSYRCVSDQSCWDPAYNLGKVACDRVLLTGAEVLELNLNQKIPSFPWQVLVSNDLFAKEDISFPEGRLLEELGTTYKLFGGAKIVSILPLQLYNYRSRDGSIKTSNPWRHQAAVENALEMERYVQIRFP